MICILLISLSLFGAKESKNTISQKTFNILQKANKLIEQKKYNSAVSVLSPIIKTSKNNYEKSFALQSLANIYIQKNNYKKVSFYYEKMLKLKAFEKDNLDRVRFSLAKIYLSSEKYTKSIKLLKTLLNNSKINKKSLYENLVYANYYGKKFKNTTFYTHKLFKYLKKPKESWYKILYSSYVEMKDYKNAIKTLNVMVKRWHKNETYWLQLISLYQEIRHYKTSLATFELAYKKGALNKNKHTLYFVNVLLQNQLYNKASLVIEKGLRNNLIKNDRKIFEMLVSSYINAKQINKAIKTINSYGYSKSPKYGMILANLYYNKQAYKKSINILEKIRIKSNTRKDGKRYILLALSYYETNKKKACAHSLKKAYKNRYERKRAHNISKSLQIKI